MPNYHTYTLFEDIKINIIFKISILVNFYFMMPFNSYIKYPFCIPGYRRADIRVPYRLIQVYQT